MNLYISDLHFGHRNVIGFDHRPFADWHEMDQYLIKMWNSRVQPDDTVYIVGDLCFRNEYTPDWYLRQLKGHKVLILGNHDQPILDNPKALHYLEEVAPLMNILDGDKQICLCHYPIIEWDGFFRGTWHIYGHIHNRKNESYEIMKNLDHALNAGCMINNYSPASFSELIRNNEQFRNS